MRGGRFIIILGGSRARLALDNTTVLDTATIGSLVGNLSVIGGKGVYTFTLISNPGGLFSISGSQLQVAAALSDGSDPITIQANNGAGSIVTQPFNITVTPPLGNDLLADTGSPMLANTGQPILVQ